MKQTRKRKNAAPPSADGLDSQVTAVVREEPFQSPAPFDKSIRAGKNSYVYDAHTYHTKVPPEGIEQLIEYYTEEGDTVVDPFCGSGMTGVAAGRLGRRAVLSDISPAAVFIAGHLNTPANEKSYLRAVRSVLAEAEELENELYSTNCRLCGSSVPMLYMVWSYGVLCPHCEREFLLWDVARDEKPSVRESKILSTFDCPHCGFLLKKRGLKRTLRSPVQVGYKCCLRGAKEQTASPNAKDLAKLKNIEKHGIPHDLWYPTSAFPTGINTRQPIAAGILRVDQAYTPRALHAMAWLWDKAKTHPDPELSGKLLFTLTSLYQRVTVFSEFRFWGGSSNTANYNVPSIFNEQNVFRTFLRKAKTISWYFRTATPKIANPDVRVASACDLSHLADKSVDYIFTDPPFGGNINYSEMNFLWESWLNRFTDTQDEAIINAVQGKTENDYYLTLARAFKECRRILKEGRWLTVVFHNSSRSVWSALERAIREAGFSVVASQTFDKTHGTFKQFVSENAVGYDLVLHCRTASDVTHATARTKTDANSDMSRFVTERLAGNPSGYRVRYLHVNRSAEWDLRKLYSEWLADRNIAADALIGFEDFRKRVAPLLPKVAKDSPQTLLFAD